MPDHFATLDQPRRPWLEEDALKQRFHRASAASHPDVTAADNTPNSSDGALFAAANAAYSILREPASRLRHLLELEAPEELQRPQPIPSEFADYFMRLAEFRSALETWKKKEHAAAGALARALLTGEKLALTARATDLQTQLETAHSVALDELRALDAAWEPRPSDAAARLASLQQRFAYLSKWRAQIAESLFQLAT